MFFDRISLTKLDFEKFQTLINSKVDISNLSFADDIEKSAVIYDINNVSNILSSNNRYKLLSEWISTLKNGSGIVVIRQALPSFIIDDYNAVVNSIINYEKQNHIGGGDHFSATKTNVRVWNSLEKVCVADPEVFANYYSNSIIEAMSQAWLGDNYQITSQINIVKPGGLAQKAHRDYHLGFQTSKSVLSYPIHIHQFSQMLTLQGAIAHCDISIKSGSTKLLPFSQLFDKGYLALSNNNFIRICEKYFIQLKMNKGDMLFFNPAIIHAAGPNKTDNTERTVNLLQISSAFSKPMETVDRDKMSLSIYPTLLEWKKKDTDINTIKRVINAVADSYPFPCNLDLHPPLSNLMSETKSKKFLNALLAEYSLEEFTKHINS